MKTPRFEPTTIHSGRVPIDYWTRSLVANTVKNGLLNAMSTETWLVAGGGIGHAVDSVLFFARTQR